MSGKSFTSLLVLCLVSLCSVQTASARNTDNADIDTVAAERQLIETTASSPGNASLKILLILGLREEANQLVRLSVDEELSAMRVEFVTADEAASADYRWPEADLYLAAGAQGCRVAVASLEQQRILCTLLTEEGFRSLEADSEEHDRLSALVIDQPVSRQAIVTNRIYPSLSRFSVFSGSETWSDDGDDPATVDGFPYLASHPMPSQLSDVLHSHDALIATSDNSIFNSSTLSTVLLTAYGYHKPVIGFSRAYVKAGALITCYSTPSQILREVAQMMRSDSLPLENAPRIFYPRYFSVIDNESVARSLGLIRDRHIIHGQTLSDEDFER